MCFFSFSRQTELGDKANQTQKKDRDLKQKDDRNKKCSICAKPGHHPSQCRYKRKDSQDNDCVVLDTRKQKHVKSALDVLAATTVCSSCRTLGHLSKDCPKLILDKAPNQLSSVGSGSTDHLSQDGSVSVNATYGIQAPPERSSLCTNCGETGHHFIECTQLTMAKPDPACEHCGQTSHRTKMCSLCEWCGQHGHLIEACPLGPYAFNLCLKCGDKGHVTSVCPHEMFCKLCKAPGHMQENCTAIKVGKLVLTQKYSKTTTTKTVLLSQPTKKGI